VVRVWAQEPPTHDDDRRDAQENHQHTTTTTADESTRRLVCRSESETSRAVASLDSAIVCSTRSWSRAR
jgi:hypothetical protein